MWRLSTICRLLRNEAYVGRLYWNRTHTRYDPALGRNRQTLRPREEWIEIPIPAIIDEDTFDAAETRARDNSIYSPRRTEPDTFLLRRLLRCAACGVKLVCHRAHRGKTTTRYYLCPHRDPWRAGGANRRCPERRVRADELDAFVFDQIRQLLARPDLLAAGETALAEQTPAADDELLAAQLDRLERRLQTTRSERGRIADLYQAGVIDSTEMRRRSAEIETRSRRFDQERQALIARQTELATDNRLQQHITGFAQQALAGIDTLDFEGRQQLMRLMLEDVRVRGWQVELRLRIPLDTNPPTSPASDKPKRTRARSPRGSRPAKEAVSSNDRLRSIGEGTKEGAECGRCHHPVREHGFGRPGTEQFNMVDVACSRHDRVHEAEYLATGQCTAHTAGQPQGRVDQRLEAETHDECRDEQKSGIGDEVRLVECHLNPVETARYLSH